MAIGPIYQKLSDLLERYTGQVLLANRHWRAEVALKPLMRENLIPDLDSLIAILDADANSLLARQCVEAMINNETCFFRDQPNFALLTGPVIDSLREQRRMSKRLRIWSAACSTGQEAYSLAMVFAENPEKWQGWNIQIIATDVSRTVLARARQGRYSQFEIQRGLPVKMMINYFTQDGEDWVVDANLQKLVSFSEHNILKPAAQLGSFDVILCRNMLMYLSEDKRKIALERLSGAMAIDGMLMLGAAETVIGQTEKFRSSRDFRGFYEKSQNDAAQIISGERLTG